MNNNEYLFKSKIYKYGFYLKNEEYFLYINPDKYKLLFLNKIDDNINGYIIVLDDISGINYNLNILKNAYIIIESKIIYNFSYNIKNNMYNLDKYKYNYMYIGLDLKNCINNFNLYNIIQSNYIRTLINEGLPYWCNFCFFINKQIRVLVQIIMIFVEIGILIWSVYQISETFPDMIKFLSLTTSEVKNYVIKSSIFILIKPVYNIINNIIYPFYIIIEMIENYLIIPIYLLLINMIQVNLNNFFKLEIIKYLTNFLNYSIYFIINLLKYFMTSFRYIYILLYNIYNVIRKWLDIIIKNIFFINFIKKKNMIKNSQKNINNIRKIYKNIKFNINFLWKTVGKPINYIYNIIKIPNIGEIGRKTKKN